MDHIDTQQRQTGMRYIDGKVDNYGIHPIIYSKFSLINASLIDFSYSAYRLQGSMQQNVISFTVPWMTYKTSEQQDGCPCTDY